MRSLKIAIRRRFDLDNLGTSIGREALAGATSFLASMYIIAVNPLILKQAGMDPAASVASTVLAAAFASLAMGIYANNPLLLAPGMSLNSLFAVSLVKTQGIPYPVALGCVFWAGVLFLALALADRKRALAGAIPACLRHGMAGGIGLFIALLGLEAAGFVAPGKGAGLVLARFQPATLTFLAGLALTAVLVVRGIKGAFLLGVLATALLAWPLGRWWAAPGGQPLVTFGGFWAWPDFSLLFCLDLVGAIKLPHLAAALVILFSCLFDSLATCLGVSEAGNLLDHENAPRSLTRSLRATAAAVMGAALLGASPATPYIESATGVREGGKSGLAAVVAGLLFLPFLFLSPLLSLAPALATAPILVLAGVFMLKPLAYVHWDRFDESLPLFLALILMPVTMSITQGIVWGCLSYTVLKVCCGKAAVVSATMWLMSIFSLAVIAGFGG